MLVSVAKTLIFLPIILIQRADCGSNLPVVPYGRKWFRPDGGSLRVKVIPASTKRGAPYIAFT